MPPRPRAPGVPGAGPAIAWILLAAAALAYDPFADARTAEANGASLAYVERGHGVPVVFVHGSGADLRTWGHQVSFFGERFRAVAYSRRYHHPNPWQGDGSDYSPALHAADLAAFLRGVVREPAHLVGSSYGGVVALLAARDHPGLVRRLVLTEPPLFSLLEPGSAESDATAGLDRARDLFNAGDTYGGLRAFVDAVFAPGAFFLMPASTRAMVDDNLRELAAEARAPSLDRSAPVTCADLGTIDVPALVITGGASASYFKAITRRLEQCLPRAEASTVDGAMHAVHAQQVEAFNRRVLAFLER